MARDMESERERKTESERELERAGLECVPQEVYAIQSPKRSAHFFELRFLLAPRDRSDTPLGGLPGKFRL